VVDHQNGEIVPVNLTAFLGARNALPAAQRGGPLRGSETAAADDDQTPDPGGVPVENIAADMRPEGKAGKEIAPAKTDRPDAGGHRFGDRLHRLGMNRVRISH